MSLHFSKQLSGADVDESAESPSSLVGEPLNVLREPCVLTEGICRSLHRILTSTVSADSLNANGEAGWGGQQGPTSELHVLHAHSQTLLSWEWSLGRSPSSGHTHTQKGGSPTPTGGHALSYCHQDSPPTRGLVSKAVVGQTEVTW